MARTGKAARSSKKEETLVAKAGHAALDNPIAAGGAVVMGLTACLIAANALGLQPGRHPAPFFTTRDRTDLPQLPEPGGRRAGVQIQEISTLVLDVQMELRKAGVYEGPLDGLNGPATQRAIRAFERRAGLPETGIANEALLAHIGLHGDLPAKAFIAVPRPKPILTGATPAGQAPFEPEVRADPWLKKVQQALSDHGYGPLEADGLMGSNTTSALKRFELDNDLPISGKPGPDVIRRLEMLSGRQLGV